MIKINVIKYKRNTTELLKKILGKINMSRNGHILTKMIIKDEFLDKTIQNKIKYKRRDTLKKLTKALQTFNTTNFLFFAGYIFKDIQIDDISILMLKICNKILKKKNYKHNEDENLFLSFFNFFINFCGAFSPKILNFDGNLFGDQDVQIYNFLAWKNYEEWLPGKTIILATKKSFSNELKKLIGFNQHLQDKYKIIQFFRILLKIRLNFWRILDIFVIFDVFYNYSVCIYILI